MLGISLPKYSLNVTDMEKDNILDQNIKATYKQGWQFLAGWSSLLMSGAFAYFSIKSQLADYSKTDAIQDIRIENIKNNQDIQGLEIKDLNERFNEMQSQMQQKRDSFAK